jgi:hypothetical protein
MKLLVIGVALVAGVSPLFAGLPFSQELTQGNVTIMLGVNRQEPIPGLVTAFGDGVQVMVKSSDKNTVEFRVTVRARVNGQPVVKSAVAPAPKVLPYTIAILETGRTEDVLSVTVEEIRAPAVQDFSAN